jgi:hypothetical protein
VLFEWLGWAFLGIMAALGHKGFSASNRGSASTVGLAIAGATAGGILAALLRPAVGHTLSVIGPAAGASLALCFGRRSQTVPRTADPGPDGSNLGSDRGAAAPNPEAETAAGVIEAAAVHQAARAVAADSANLEPDQDADMVEAFGWAMLCAPVFTLGSIAGWQAAKPPGPEFFPIDVAFILLAALPIGFGAPMIARWLRPQWTAWQMGWFVSVLTLTSSVGLFASGALLETERIVNAPPRVALTIGPNPGLASRCGPRTICDPGMQWLADGTLSVQNLSSREVELEIINVNSHSPGRTARDSTSGPGTRYDVFSASPAPPSAPNPIITKAIRPSAVARIPLRYSYRTEDGSPGRIVTVDILLISVRDHITAAAEWTMR